MQTEYRTVTFNKPQRAFVGRTAVTAVSAGKGVSLTRVTEDGRDDLLIASERHTTVMPWSNVGVAVPLDPSALLETSAPRGAASKLAGQSQQPQQSTKPNPLKDAAK